MKKFSFLILLGLVLVSLVSLTANGSQLLMEQLKSENLRLQSELSALKHARKEELKQIVQQKDFKLRNFQSEAELEAFLKLDKTDEKQFPDCLQYSIALARSALEHGYAVSLLAYDVKGPYSIHVINIAYIDGVGWFTIEPQSDEYWVGLGVGQESRSDQLYPLQNSSKVPQELE